MVERKRPGGELRKEYRVIVEYLIDTQGWRYEWNGSGYPRLYPDNADQRFITIPKTPSSQRSLIKFESKIRRAGGEWPPGRKAKNG